MRRWEGEEEEEEGGAPEGGGGAPVSATASGSLCAAVSGLLSQPPRRSTRTLMGASPFDARGPWPGSALPRLRRPLARLSNGCLGLEPAAAAEREEAPVATVWMRWRID